MIAYGPLLLALGAALAVHRRLEKGWNPLGAIELAAALSSVPTSSCTRCLKAATDTICRLSH